MRFFSASGRGSSKQEPGDVDGEPSVYTLLQRVSVVLGLLAIAPLARIWEKPWWLRVLFALIAAGLLAATTYDLLPRWSRRRPLAVGVLLALAVAVALVPDVRWRQARIAPETAGRATIESPRNGQHQALLVREAGGHTDGFTATGTCQVPPGYHAVIVSRAANGKGYWLLSEEILDECVADDSSRRWTARRVDPSWSGMEADEPVTLAVVILRNDLFTKAKSQQVTGDPLKLPSPATTTRIQVTRVQQPDS
jgi:hypothetical protein